MPSAGRAIRKAVFPVAGLGTRFLPATKASPKEMLPIADKPLIQYAVEEAIAAGAEELIFIIGRAKQALIDHLDRNFELESQLARRGEADKLEIVRSIVPPEVSCLFVRQAEPLGLGHAVLCARAAVGNEPFAVLLPDDLLWNPRKVALAQMVDAWCGTGGSAVAVESVSEDDAQFYGIVALAEGEESRIAQIQEKPPLGTALSNLAVVGRYILEPGIFDCLERICKGSGSEIQLSDAIGLLIGSGAPVHAFRFDAQRYDCGSKRGYLRAVIDYALRDAELSEGLRAYLRTLE